MTEHIQTMHNMPQHWMNLENMMLSKRRQAQKARWCMFPFICRTWKRQIHRHKSRSVVTRGWEEGKQELVSNGYRKGKSIGTEGLPRWLGGKESACQAGDIDSIPGPRRFPGEGNGNPLQYSCLGNPMGRGAWWATVHGVARVGHDLATKQQQQIETGGRLVVARGWENGEWLLHR